MLYINNKKIADILAAIILFAANIYKKDLYNNGETLLYIMNTVGDVAHIWITNTNGNLNLDIDVRRNGEYEFENITNGAEEVLRDFLFAKFSSLNFM